MWVKSYSKSFLGVSKNAIWRAWMDIHSWPKWDKDIESCRMEGPFSGGTVFFIKPKGRSEVQLQLVEVAYLDSFTYLWHFWGVSLWGKCEMQEIEGGVRLTATITVKGWLSWVWVFLKARSFVDTIPYQMESLIAYTTQHEKERCHMIEH